MPEPTSEKKAIAAEIARLLRAHRAGRAGNVKHEPYKRVFFDLFAKAFHAGYMELGHPNFLKAGAMVLAVEEADPTLAKDPNLATLYGYWQEWEYACSRI